MTLDPRPHQTQLRFNWDDSAQQVQPAECIPSEPTSPSAPKPPDLSDACGPTCDAAPDIDDAPSASDPADGPPVLVPLPQAVEHGVFGWTDEGPIEPDEEQVAALTTEHASEMILLLCDLSAVQDALRTGRDPNTGRVPSKPEGNERLTDRLGKEATRLTTAYANAVAAFADGFGDQAAAALDGWVRQAVAGERGSNGSYPPSHPWHYYHGGDNAAPIPVGEIPPNEDVGRYLESELPKNPAKRIARLRELLDRERAQLEADRRRYQDIVERGAEALSRFDREIAHTSDAMARASALALKYSHISYGLGRVEWIEDRLRSEAPLLIDTTPRS